MLRGKRINPRFVGIIKFFLKPNWFLNAERIEYSALYCADIQDIKDFHENDEMKELCWYTRGEPIENANGIDVKLLDYYE